MNRLTRRTSRPVPARWLVVLGALLLTFVVAACSSAGSAAGPGDLSGRDRGGTAVDEGGLPGVDGFLNDGGGLGDIADRRIIKTGEVTIEVAEIAASLGRVRALAIELGGYVGGSFLGARDDYATLTLRIPADRFDDALTRLRAFDGEVLTEATREEDVTSALVDLEARLRNLNASEQQYLELLERTGTVEEILAVQIRLDEVRGQIEQLEAQVKDLSEMADLATLTVSLVPSSLQQATNTWDPGKTVSDAIAALVQTGQSVVNGVIWFAIVWLPALIVLAIVLALVLRFIPSLRRLPGLRRRRGPASAPEA
ncbi:MAG: DUF4349 domain-containing protein [Candidatus Limnocylindria bacterium]